MYLIILATFSLSAGILGAYTSRVQATTLWAGKILAGYEFSQQMPRGFQDAITPKSQTIRNLVVHLSFILILVFGSLQAWYLGIVALFAAYLTYMIAAILIPDDLEYYLLRLISKLDNREADYRKNNDVMRADAAHEMSVRLKDLLLEIHGKGMRVPLISDTRKM
jgi:hypothetical protein